jgi:hypothetical protein
MQGKYFLKNKFLGQFFFVVGSFMDSWCIWSNFGALEVDKAT